MSTAKSITILAGSSVLGKMRGYLASVASGGTGTVTLNVVVWLMNAPSVSRMRAALQSREFRDKAIILTQWYEGSHRRTIKDRYWNKK
jgi:hypothetical protein